MVGSYEDGAWGKFGEIESRLLGWPGQGMQALELADGGLHDPAEERETMMNFQRHRVS